MRILALDSSQNLQSFAVYNDEEQVFIFSETFSGQSSEIVERLRNNFSKSELSLKDINLLAVNLGPGSFTGIRNILCIVKTLAIELKLPVFTSNTFELLRFEQKISPNEAIAIPAFKNNFFISLNSNYDSKESNFFSLSETEIPLYRFSSSNLSELLIKFLLSDNSLKILINDPEKLVPYYLRDPSIGKKIVCQ